MPRKVQKPAGPPETPRETPAVKDAAEPQVVEVQGPAVLCFPEGDPGNSRVRIMREGDDKRWVTHGYLATDEAGPEKVAELFGGGKWMAQLISAGETGRAQVMRSVVFRVPGPYRPPTGPLPGTAPAVPVVMPGAPAAPSGGSGGIAAVESLLSSMQRGNLSPREALDQAMVAQLLEISRVRQQGAPDWAGVLTAVLPSLVEVLFRRGPDPQMVAMLERMEAKLSQQGGPVSSGIGDITKAIEQLLSVRDRLRDSSDEGRSGDGEGNGGLLKEGLGLIQTLLQAQAQGAMATGPGPAGPSRIPGKVEVPAMTPAPVPAPDPGPARPLWQQLMQRHRGQLVDAARRGLPVEFVADMVMNYLPAEYVGVLTEFLARPDAAAVAMQEIPELAEFPKWNEKFWGSLKDGMQEEGGDDD